MPAAGVSAFGAESVALLDEALTRALSEDLSALPGAVLADRVLALSQAASRLHAAWAAAAAAFDASGVWELDGAASAGGWLRARANLAPGAARALVREGRLLREALPETAQALAAGQITPAHVRVLTAVCEKNTERRQAITDAEPVLVQAARELDPTGLRQVVDRWTCQVDPVTAAADDTDRFSARWLSVSRTFGGMVAIDGLLDPEGGTVLLTALDALTDRAYDRLDDRTPRQRRADALVEAARHVLDHGELPQTGGHRPHLMLTIDHTVAQGSATAGAELDRAGPITAEAALRMLCDAQLTPLLVDDQGQPLDIGRARRTIPPAVRRAVIARDTHCVFTGCDRPPQWCEVHHVQPWSQGGATALPNLVLLCRRHHRALHHDGFTLTGTPGHTLATLRPDGTPITTSKTPAPTHPPERPPPRAPHW
jgi:hypothetical protein